MSSASLSTLSPYLSAKKATDPARRVLGSRSSRRAAEIAPNPTARQNLLRPASSNARNAPSTAKSLMPVSKVLLFGTDCRYLRVSSNARRNSPRDYSWVVSQFPGNRCRNTARALESRIRGGEPAISGVSCPPTRSDHAAFNSLDPNAFLFRLGDRRMRVCWPVRLTIKTALSTVTSSLPQPISRTQSRSA